MKRIALALALTALAGCSVVPNLATKDFVSGTVTPGPDVLIAITQGTGADLTGSAIVKPDASGHFSYEIPADADALTLCAFRDSNRNGQYDEGEPNSLNSSYVQLTKVNDKWSVIQHNGSMPTNLDAFNNAVIVFQG